MGREGTMFFLLEYYNYLDMLNVEIEDTDKLWHQKLKSVSTHILKYLDNLSDLG